MILPHNNRYLAKQYFESLPPSDINVKFYEGNKYETPTSLLGTIYNHFFIQQKMNTLLKFYPYQKTIKATQLEMETDRNDSLQNCLLFTAVAWAGIFQFARRGVVLPLLKEYGSYLNTHRIFRHYLYALIGPLAFSSYFYHRKYYTHVEHLWIIHSNRLNQKVLEDPLYTYYPKSKEDARRTTFVPVLFQDPV